MIPRRKQIENGLLGDDFREIIDWLETPAEHFIPEIPEDSE